MEYEKQERVNEPEKCVGSVMILNNTILLPPFLHTTNLVRRRILYILNVA